jgi:SAM-dependent methyltransferase
MAEDWNDYADGWDDSSDVRLYADRAFASLVSTVDIRAPVWKSKRVLDFGCGTGLLAEKVAPYVGDLIAVDTSDKMIAVLERKKLDRVTALCGDILDDALRARIGPSGFDLIYASSVCGFLPDYEKTVVSLARLLKPGGRFVQWDWLASGDDGTGLTMGRIERALGKAGLQSVQAGRAFSMAANGTDLPVLIGVGTTRSRSSLD